MDERLENIVKRRELTRRNFIKKAVKGSLYTLLAASGFGSLANCKKEKKDGIPVSDDYIINAYCLDMTSLSGFDFVDRLPVSGATLLVNDNPLQPGEYTSSEPGHFRFQHKGHSIRLNYNGGVHDSVLCVREPGGSTNLYQEQNSSSANINLQNLMQGNEVDIYLFKIPSWVNIGWVKEALTKGSAIYTHPVTVYLKNDEYTDQEWPQAKQSAINHINNVLPQINPCTTGITAILDENADSGDLKVRLGKSFHYINPGHGEIVNNGIIDNSFIKISANPLEVYYYLAELYQAMGVRHEIGPDGIAEEVANSTDRLNRFGKALMRINYFLNPDTHL